MECERRVDDGGCWGLSNLSLWLCCALQKLFIHILYIPFMRQSRPTTSSQAPHKSSSNTATQQQHNGNNGNKKKPKYVKLTMSSKRFNMLALHVLPACLLAPYTPTLHLLHSSPLLLLAHRLPTRVLLVHAITRQIFSKLLTNTLNRTQNGASHTSTRAHTHTLHLHGGVLHGEKSKKLWIKMRLFGLLTRRAEVGEGEWLPASSNCDYEMRNILTQITLKTIQNICLIFACSAGACPKHSRVVSPASPLPPARLP